MRTNWKASARVKHKIKGGSTGGVTARPGAVSATSGVAGMGVSGRASAAITGFPGTTLLGGLTIPLGAYLVGAGVEGTGGAGSVTASGKATSPATGAAAAGFAGQAQAEGTASNNASAPLTTVAATSALGSLTPQGKANVPAPRVTGTLSLGTTLIRDLTPPQVPTGLAANAASSTQINLGWNASSDPAATGETSTGVAGYRVYQGGVLRETIGNVTTYQATGLTANTPYTFTVAAYDGAGNTSDQSVSAGATTSSLVINNYYTTTFPLTENPISEGGAWVNGKTTGLEWYDFRSEPGLAYGTMPLQDFTRNFSDSTAILTGTWDPDQTVECVVKTVNKPTAHNYLEELEIRLRSTVSPNVNSGYECLWSCQSDAASTYIQIWKWDGPYDPTGNTTFHSISGVGGSSSHILNDGDSIKASISGSTITMWRKPVGSSTWTQQLQASVTQDMNGNPLPVITTGNPGIGSYNWNGTNQEARNIDFGFRSFTAYSNRAAASVWPNGVYATVSSWSALATAVANAPDGSIIQLANGTYSATSTISTSKGLLIRAQNYTPTPGGTMTRNVTITNNVGQMFAFTTQNTYHPGVAGIRFNAGTTGNYLALSGTGSKVPLVADCSFEFPFRNGNNPGDAFIAALSVGGVFWNCYFRCDTSPASIYNGGLGIFTRHPWGWQSSSTMGQLDTSGNVNIYIENSTAFNCSTFTDVDAAGRMVIRNSDINGSYTLTHGFTSGMYNGGRFVEFYDNTIRATDPNRDMSGLYFWMRAGTFVFTGNDVQASANVLYSQPNFFNIGDTPSPSGNDGPMQPGWGHNGTTDVRDPMYSWGNTGARANSWGFQVSAWGPPVTVVASTPGQAGAELFVNLGAKPGWSRYPYPHPLRFT